VYRLRRGDVAGAFCRDSTRKQTLKFKLDENLDPRCAQLFAGAGHDCSTVSKQGLAGSTDSALIMHCRAEGRALITLDLDFANPLLFKPSAYRGIAVLRLRSPASPHQLDALCLTVLGGLSRDTLDGHLWIIEPGIRIHQEEP
jgi:predicted nuclease of predicted toxin-antitoxin system